jgi:hypothetical protein
MMYLNAMRTAQTPLIVTAIFLPTFPLPDILEAIDDLSPNKVESKRENSHQNLTYHSLWQYQLSQILPLVPRSNPGSTRGGQKDRLPCSLLQYWVEQLPSQMFDAVLHKRLRETERRFLES